MRLCDDIRAHRLDAVVAVDQDRLVREPCELELFLALCDESGVAHIVTSEGDITPENRALARIRASAASHEIISMSKRHRRVQEDLALAGRYSGGYRGFGYSRDHLTIIEEEAGLLRDAAARVRAGETVGAIAREWNHAVVKTALGHTWRGLSLKQILTSPAVTGLREHHGQVVAEAVWPAILDRETWAAVRQTLAARSASRRSRPPRDYLLTRGVAVCALCGAPLRARPRSDGVRSYVCVKERRADGSTPCGHMRCVSEPLENTVIDAIVAMIDGGTCVGLVQPARSLQAQRRRSELTALLADTERKLTLAEERYLEGDISRASYERVRDRHLEVAGNVRCQLTEIAQRQLPEGIPHSGAELKRWWSEATIVQRRLVLTGLVEEVRVGPAPHRGARYSEDRVAIVWKVAGAETSSM